MISKGLWERLEMNLKQTPRSLTDLIGSREKLYQQALEAGTELVDVEDVKVVAYSEPAELAPIERENSNPTLLPKVGVTGNNVPSKLIIEVFPNETYHLEGLVDSVSHEPGLLTLNSSLSGESLRALKEWGNKVAPKAAEVLNKYVRGNKNKIKAAPYYFQRRSFALVVGQVPNEELKWLKNQELEYQEITLHGHKEPTKVVVIPQELATERPTLSTYIRTHLHLLEGSAPFKALKDKEREKIVVVGCYYPRLMMVPLETLKEVLKNVDETPPGDLEEVRLEVEGKKRRYRVVLVDDAPFLRL